MPSPLAPPPQNKSKVVLAQSQHLPAQLLKLLEEWHEEHPEEPPCASHSKKSLSTEAELYRYFSRDSQELPALEEITISRPARYSVYYLPISDGNEKGILIKFVSWGSRRHFLKQWLGGYRFRAEPVAVRLTALNGAFTAIPDEESWETATKRKLPNELKEEGAENTQSSIRSKRRRVQERESTASSLSSLQSMQSVSSFGSDIPPQIIKGPSADVRRNRDSVSKQRRTSEPIIQLSEADSSDGEYEEEEDGIENEETDDEGEDEEEDKDEDPAAPVGLSNGGLPIISRSESHTGHLPTSASSSTQKQTKNTRPTRKSLPSALKTRPSLSELVNTPGTASDSGVEFPNPSGPSLIKFKLLVPRTKMVRDLRVEGSQDNSKYLFDQAKAFFNRYDRKIESPVLECVVEGEPECRCIYNAKELSYFIEELRERSGILKVIVTQGY